MHIFWWLKLISRKILAIWKYLLFPIMNWLVATLMIAGNFQISSLFDKLQNSKSQRSRHRVSPSPSKKQPPRLQFSFKVKPAFPMLNWCVYYYYTRPSSCVLVSFWTVANQRLKSFCRIISLFGGPIPFCNHLLIDCICIMILHWQLV